MVDINKNYTTVSAEIILETEHGPIPFVDLSYFMYLFRAIYVAGIDELAFFENYDESSNYSEQIFQRYASRVRESIKKNNGITIRNLARRNLPENIDLTIEDISRRNPIDISAIGVLAPLIAVSIMAGGSYQLKSLKITIPSPKKAIKRLTSLFSKTKTD